MGHPEQLDNIVVAKVGSSTLVDSKGALDRAFVADLCSQVAVLSSEGYRLVIVSSGAGAAGAERLGLSSKPSDVPGIQACCAAGQAVVTETYAEALAKHGLTCGQVLLTREGVTDREGYLNARNTLDRLVEFGCVPVINENDTVSVGEITFGDNDMLGAIVSALIGASHYVVLSDVEGLYSANPDVDPTATLVDTVTSVDESILAIAGGPTSGVGTGGMASKVRAGRAMLASGIPMTICLGRRRDALIAAVHGDGRGTRFVAPAESSRENARKLWIGLAGMSRGSVIIDEGAERALVEDGASLLPVGVIGSTGDFSEGDVVSVFSRAGSLIGKGITRYSSDEIRRAMGLKLDVLSRFMPLKAEQPCIHRDELLLF